MTHPNFLHSRLRIASFCISLILLFLILLLDPIDYMKGRMYIRFLVLALIGIGLAISGMFAKHRNRLFPLLGCIVNTACLVASLAIR